MRSLGIDVSEKRGLDLVLLDESSPPLLRHLTKPAEVAGSVREWQPDVVAIDSPPAWGTRGASRQCERDLKRLGIQAFYTPGPSGADHSFYQWMKVGIEAHRVCHEAGLTRYQSGPVRGHTLEVFPHATAVSLAGCLPRSSRTASAKLAFRTPLLRERGIETGPWRSLDCIDAALAALTGLLALRDEFTAVGDPEEGIIVLPAKPLPEAPYRICPSVPKAEAQLNLPGESPCQCDPRCGERTSHRFAPGHDAKLKSRLWREVRDGEEALARLKELGWERPPKLRQR